MGTEVRYIRNAWYMAGWQKDFPAGKPGGAMLLGKPLAFYRRSDGRLVALEDRCPHRLAPLSRGRVEGDDLRCLYHRLKFSGAGSCVEVPGSAARPRASSATVPCSSGWATPTAIDPGRRAFTEDREILTDQQHSIDLDPSRKMAFFEVDRATALYHRVVEELLDQERRA